MLTGKKVVLGISGSIAAYKAINLLRILIKKQAEVQVILTPSGREFVTPITLSALTQKPVINEFFSANNGVWNSHVNLGLWADLMLIAPATASTLGKMANGIADNMLITTYLSMKAPVWIAPAMDANMLIHPSTKSNLQKLKLYGNHIIPPSVGYLASSIEGKGRMEEPKQIVQVIESFFKKKKELDGIKILVTAGPTYEKIDPVRYISNYSSGKMGFALAEECANRGAEIILISGPVILKPVSSKIKCIYVESAEEMYHIVINQFHKVNVGILCAAVSDYKPLNYYSHKMKIHHTKPFSLELIPNHDIAFSLGKLKKNNQILIGFALETKEELINAKTKLEQKNLDFIVLNSLKDKGAGFKTDTNKITILDRDGVQNQFPLKHKTEVAKDIANYLIAFLSKNYNNNLHS